MEQEIDNENNEKINNEYRKQLYYDFYKKKKRSIKDYQLIPIWISLFVLYSFSFALLSVTAHQNNIYDFPTPKEYYSYGVSDNIMPETLKLNPYKQSINKSNNIQVVYNDIWKEEMNEFLQNAKSIVWDKDIREVEDQAFQVFDRRSAVINMQDFDKKENIPLVILQPRMIIEGNTLSEVNKMFQLSISKDEKTVVANDVNENELPLYKQLNSITNIKVMPSNNNTYQVEFKIK